MNALPEPHRKRVKNLNIEGHVHFYTCSTYQRLPLLTNATWCEWLCNHIRSACDRHDFALWAYVIMPEHLHLLVKPQRRSYDLAVFKRGVKEAFSRRVISSLKESQSPLLERLWVRERPGQRTFRFWQEGGGVDLNLWTLEKIVSKAEYCHLNPVRRALTRQPDRWRWSSFRWLEWGSRENEPLRVDDWYETLLD